MSILSDGRRVRSEMLLYCAGRTGGYRDASRWKPAGSPPTSAGRLAVNPVTFQTAVPHIYAAGDVIGFPSLASTSMEQGRIAACHAFGAAMASRRRNIFPYGIYAVPEISTVGLSEQQAREKGIAYEVGVARFRETSRGHIMGLETGMMKMLFRLDDRRLLGVHIPRRRGDGARPHRAGGAQPRRHARLFRREHLQLPDARRSLQDRGAGTPSNRMPVKAQTALPAA